MNTNSKTYLPGRSSGTGRAALAVLAIIALCLGLMRTARADTLLSEGFEGNFPFDNGWTVGDANGTGTTAYWDDVNNLFGVGGTHTGNWKGYCAGIGYGGTTAAPLYQTYMDAYMQKTLDLRSVCSPSLSFWYRTPSIEPINPPFNYDYLLVKVGGTVVFSNGIANASWNNVVVNLSDWTGTQPVLDFTFHSDSSVVYEGVYLDDILVTATPALATIYSPTVAWGTQSDNDGDGCLTAPANTFRLIWDPDTCFGGTTLSVFEKIYRRPCGGAYTLYYTTPSHTISGTSSGDTQFLDIPASSSCACYDYYIEVYRTGQTVPDTYRDLNSNPVLGGHREELLSQETATIYSASFSNQVDRDGDGCWASTNNNFRITYDVDVVGANGTLNVFEKVYYRSCGSASWSLTATTPNHVISGNAGADSVFVDVGSGADCSCWDYRIETYRVGQGTPDFTMDNSNNANLASHREEFSSEDWPMVYLYPFGTSWSNQQDTDGDGCWTAPNDTFRLVYDVDTTNCEPYTVTVYEKVYSRVTGTSPWTLYTTTPQHLITNCLASDSVYVDLPAHSACSLYDYKIELYRLGHPTPDFVADPSNFAALGSHKEELQSQETAFIFGAYFSNQVDRDGDGCWASTNNTFRITYDVDVVGASGTLNVFEKVYFRQCGAGAWSSPFTTPNHSITGYSGSDSVFVDIGAGAGCSCYDYRIETYRVGQVVPDFTLDNSNNANLASHREEYSSEDWPMVYLYPNGTAWSNQSDNDGDGCWTAPNDTFRLRYDPDVTNNETYTVTVYEKVYSRPAGTIPWTLYTTTANHWITNQLASDAVYVDLPAHSSCGLYDYKIELYRLDHAAPDFVADPSNTAALSAHKEELLSEEKARLYGAYWANQQDSDGDGCWAAPSNTFRLVYDPDVTGCNGTLTVFEKVYLQSCGAGTWNLFTTTANHVITGCPVDANYVDIPAGSGCSCYNYLIEVYRAGQVVPDYALGPTNYAAVLADHREELYLQDTNDCSLATATVYEAWWSYQVDTDGDNCWEATAPTGYHLNWDPDVSLGGICTLDVFEKVYLRQCGSATWTPWTTTASHTITGWSTADQQFIDMPAGSACTCYEYKIEVYRTGQVAPDYTRDQTNDLDLANHREEALNRPPLTITRAGSNVVLSWPSSYIGFRLQSASALPPGSWGPVGPPPVIVGSQWNVTNAIGSKTFYRLVNP